MLKHTLFSGLLLSGALVCASPAQAVDGLTLEAGRTGESSNSFRLAVQWDFGKTLWQSDAGAVKLKGFWDAGIVHWAGKSATNLGLSPVFRLEFADQGGWTPYLEGAIGVALFNRTNLDRRTDLGSKFQFEDRVGLGVRFAGQHELGLRWYHYSNAGLKQPNNGIETTTLHYTRHF